jgi:hypothetical protein
VVGLGVAVTVVVVAVGLEWKCTGLVMVVMVAMVMAVVGGKGQSGCVRVVVMFVVDVACQVAGWGGGYRMGGRGWRWYGGGWQVDHLECVVGCGWC